MVFPKKSCKTLIINFYLLNVKKFYRFVVLASNRFNYISSEI